MMHDSAYGTVLNGVYPQQVIWVASKPPNSIRNDNTISELSVTSSGTMWGSRTRMHLISDCSQGWYCWMCRCTDSLRTQTQTRMLGIGFNRPLYLCHRTIYNLQLAVTVSSMQHTVNTTVTLPMTINESQWSHNPPQLAAPLYSPTDCWLPASVWCGLGLRTL